MQYLKKMIMMHFMRLMGNPPFVIILGNSFLRFARLRRFMVRIWLFASGAITKNMAKDKASAIDRFLLMILEERNIESYFIDQFIGIDKQVRIEEKKDIFSIIKHFFSCIKKYIFDYSIPGSLFKERLYSYLFNIQGSEIEHCYLIDDLIRLERELVLKSRKKNENYDNVFQKSDLRRFYSHFPKQIADKPIPVSYISFFFPKFIEEYFIKRKANIFFGMKKMFNCEEMIRVSELLLSLIRLRNKKNTLQRFMPKIKKTCLIIFLIWLIVPLAIDISILLYGILKNDYHYSLPFFQRNSTTIDTPYARRTARIYAMNKESDLDQFVVNGNKPGLCDDMHIVKNSQMTVELSYSAYESIRKQHQNGLSIISLREKNFNNLKNSNKKKYCELFYHVYGKGNLIILFEAIDNIFNSELSRYYINSYSFNDIKKAISKKLSESSDPVVWLNPIVHDYSLANVYYYKPNSMKWTQLKKIPRVMIDSLILLEDRRFKNNFFPIPHRGNDNLAVVPQVLKKLLIRLSSGIFEVCSKYEWNKPALIVKSFKKKLIEETSAYDRGGSSILNQVVEMLYSKNIPSMNPELPFEQRQIEQKKYELPASAMIHWFWNKDEILEAYVNEVYGGHLYGDIRGFRSEAEMYFCRSLGELSLREQIMIIAAIKKPSRIKEYALYLKASELQKIIEYGKRADIEKWENDNLVYHVNVQNFKNIIETKIKSARWIERRMNHILNLLKDEGSISLSEYIAAKKGAVNFKFNTGIYSYDQRLVNNIIKEMDDKFGNGASDSGMVVISSIDGEMQKSLQDVIDRNTRYVAVDPDLLSDGQPLNVLVECGGRIIKAYENIYKDKPAILNRIVADVGGSSNIEDEWDWISQANRSLGSSLKPILDLYLLLKGYNLHDQFRDMELSYKIYTLEQRKIYSNFIKKHPDNHKSIEDIKRNWIWTPKNFTPHTGAWMSVQEALVHSVNSVHVQIQEIVTPEIFSELLNQTMNISRKELKHPAYRSIILGGSSGDQRFDRYLLSYSIFPNRGIIKESTYFDVVMNHDDTYFYPDYKPIKCQLLDKYGENKLKAACLLIETALRDTVKNGTMRALDEIGAGKTGTSNELRDALATVHFINDKDMYIAGIRLGNKKNYSIGRAADRIAAPVLKTIIDRCFNKNKIESKNTFDEYLYNRIKNCKTILKSKNHQYLKDSPAFPRKLSVDDIKETERIFYLKRADDEFSDGNYETAASLYEKFLERAVSFSSRHPAFDKMIRCYMKIDKPERAGQIIERFSLPGKIYAYKRYYEKEYDVALKIDRSFYGLEDKLFTGRNESNASDDDSVKSKKKRRDLKRGELKSSSEASLGKNHKIDTQPLTEAQGENKTKNENYDEPGKNSE